jgi:hypothetical protein
VRDLDHVSLMTSPGMTVRDRPPWCTIRQAPTPRTSTTRPATRARRRHGNCVFAGLLVALSRNPAKEARLMQIVLLGFALTEAMGLLAIMMAFLILYS